MDGINNNRIIVPCGQRLPLIKEYHDSPLGGHFGLDKNYLSMRRHFYWPGMKDLLKRYIQSCDYCQKNKSWNKKPLGNPQLQDQPQDTWQIVSLDYCGPFPTTTNKNDYVMVVSDHLSKMNYLIPCKQTINAKETARLFKNVVFRHH